MASERLLLSTLPALSVISTSTKPGSRRGYWLWIASTEAGKAGSDKVNREKLTETGRDASPFRRHWSSCARVRLSTYRSRSRISPFSSISGMKRPDETRRPFSSRPRTRASAPVTVPSVMLTLGWKYTVNRFGRIKSPAECSVAPWAQSCRYWRGTRSQRTMDRASLTSSLPVNTPSAQV